MRHILCVDGREIASGSQGEAIESVKLTRSFSDGQSLCVGAVCPAVAEIRLLDLERPIAVGTELQLLQEDRTPLGVFYCQSAQTKGQVTALTAFDGLLALEKDLTLWLESLTQWPYSVEDFAHMVCAQCGVALEETALPNGAYSVEKFSAEGITGRDLMGFVGELAGGALVANPDGTAGFRWYAPKDFPLEAGGEHYCFSIDLADFQTLPIDKVQIRATEQDVGVVHPDTEGENAYIIQGNPLLGGGADSIVQSLYSILAGHSYTPGSVTVPADYPIEAGDIVTVGGKTFYVMETEKAGQSLRLSGFGSPQRNSAPARNARKFQSLKGKILELTTRVDGITAENRDMQGNLAKLALDVGGISASVSAQTAENTAVQQKITQLQQTASGLSASVKTITDNGVSRVENQFGVKLDGSSFTIHRQDSEMTNRLDEKGMYVVRNDGAGETMMLRADASGVLATDVTVGNFLRVGHARFEDYEQNRTACYYC